MTIIVIHNCECITQLMIQRDNQNCIWSWKCPKYDQFIHIITQRWNSRSMGPHNRTIEWKATQENSDSEWAPNTPLLSYVGPRRLVMSNPETRAGMKNSFCSTIQDLPSLSYIMVISVWTRHKGLKTTYEAQFGPPGLLGFIKDLPFCANAAMPLQENGYSLNKEHDRQLQVVIGSSLASLDKSSLSTICAQWSGRFSGITSWDPRVLQVQPVNRLHVHILRFSFTKLRNIL